MNYSRAIMSSVISFSMSFPQTRTLVACHKNVLTYWPPKSSCGNKDVSLARALTIRNLDALAFCEFFGASSDRKVLSVPSSLARLPTTPPKQCLPALGWRNLEYDRDYCRDLKILIETTEQEGVMAHLCPSRIQLSADSDRALFTICRTRRNAVCTDSGFVGPIPR